jgi:hypothetical protein
MSEPLGVYLQDHLAARVHAIGLVAYMRDQHANDPIGPFAAQLLAETEIDRQVLRGIAERVGVGSDGVQEAGAWLFDEVSRLKLGIHGKWALWRALPWLAAGDSRLQGTDFEQLAARAESQRAKLDERRLQAARAAWR